METTGNETPVVINHVGHGQSESFFIAKFGNVTAATLLAAEALSLEVKENKVEKDQAIFSFYDATKDRIDILIVRRSDTMTSIKFDVGWFGSVAFGRLMLRQIISELHRSETVLQDSKPK